jgi:3-hydroxybutyryl-CoA dehydrogenase
MRVAVVANDETKAEWLKHGLKPGTEAVWLDRPSTADGATVFIDLLFDDSPQRAEEWAAITNAPVIVNDVVGIKEELPPNFIRINGWPTFLERAVIEASGPLSLKQKAAEVFEAFNRTTEWVPDIPGFISARIVSMVINEAYFSLDEGVSSNQEIDTAMKLGTNYPYGPFEWGEKIGLHAVYRLLDKLSVTNSRYTPSRLLKKEALKQ